MTGYTRGMPPKLLLPQAMVDPTTLSPHPMNAKLHNEAWLQRSIQGLGLVQAIVVNKGTRTGRPNEILSGHGTVKAFMTENPGDPVQVSYVDVDEDTAKRILLNMNPGPNDPGYDARLQAELLESLPDLDFLDWEPGDLDLLTARLNADIDVFPDYTDTEPDEDDSDGGGGDDKNGRGREVACPKCGHTFTPSR